MPAIRPAALFAVSAVLVVLGGCGTWTHPTKPATALESDRLQCAVQAMQAFPVQMATRIDQPARTEPGRSSCTTTGNRTDCVNWPAQVIPATYASYDANKDRRDRAQSQCLSDAGWVYKLD